MYSAGKIPGSFFKREGRPTTTAILTARLTDRPLRPLFPEGYRNEVQVIITTFAIDMVNDPGPIGAALTTEFKTRRDEQRWKTGYENQVQLSPDERIEKTVFIKAPETFKYGDVVKVIDVVKGAGANPVGLQTEALEP